MPISLVVFFCHTYGWGLLGLMCFSADAVRLHDRGRTWWRAGIEAALHTSVMALPILIMLIWRSETHGGQTIDWFDWKVKWRWIYSALRDRWKWFDIGSLIAAALVFVYAIFSRKLTLSRNLAFSAIVLADLLRDPSADRLRLGLCRHAAGSLSDGGRAARNPLPRRARPADRAGACRAWAAVLRDANGRPTRSAWRLPRDDQTAKLQAIDLMPRGARVITLAGMTCRNIGRCCATAIWARW